MEHRTVFFLASTLVVGGAEKVIESLAFGLPEHGYRPRILCLNGPGPIGAELSRRGVPLHSGLMRFKYDPFVYPRLYRLFRRERDAILCSLDHHDALFWGALASGAAGIRPRVTQSHSTGLWGGKSSFSRTDRWVLPRYDRVIALSPKHADYIARQGRIDRARIAVIGNGVDTERFRPADSSAQRARIRESIGLAADDYTVTIVAALRPEKNHEMFLRAALEFRDRGQTGIFLIVGGGAEARKLHALAGELGLEQTVRFTGPREDIRDILVASDVSVLCSHAIVETFPLSVLEAMSTALPVVVTPVGSIPEMITDGVHGIMVPTGDVSALAEALLDLKRDPDRRREMGKRARALVATKYSEARMVAAYAELFESLTGDGAKGQE